MLRALRRAQKGGFAGILWRIFEACIRTRFGTHPIPFFIARLNPDDLLVLKELIGSGKPSDPPLGDLRTAFTTTAHRRSNVRHKKNRKELST